MTGGGDKLWLRVLDVPALLAGRRYPAEVAITLEVDDPLRPGTAGRYRLEGGPAGATCARTDGPADLALGVAELGSIVLGGGPGRDLARAGRVVASPSSMLPDPVDAATAAFAWPVAPHCLTRF